jgi:hypothetical protein
VGNYKKLKTFKKSLDNGRPKKGSKLSSNLQRSLMQVRGSSSHSKKRLPKANLRASLRIKDKYSLKKNVGMIRGSKSKKNDFQKSLRNLK